MPPGTKTLPLNRRTIARGLNNHAELITALREEVLKQKDQMDALLAGHAQHEQRLGGVDGNLDLLNKASAADSDILYRDSFRERLRWLLTGK